MTRIDEAGVPMVVFFHSIWSNPGMYRAILFTNREKNGHFFNRLLEKNG